MALCGFCNDRLISFCGFVVSELYASGGMLRIHWKWTVSESVSLLQEGFRMK